jgi:hypothetical protein
LHGPAIPVGHAPGACQFILARCMPAHDVQRRAPTHGAICTFWAVHLRRRKKAVRYKPYARACTGRMPVYFGPVHAGACRHMTCTGGTGPWNDMHLFLAGAHPTVEKAVGWMHRSHFGHAPACSEVHSQKNRPVHASASRPVHAVAYDMHRVHVHALACTDVHASSFWPVPAGLFSCTVVSAVHGTCTDMNRHAPTSACPVATVISWPAKWGRFSRSDILEFERDCIT